MHALRPIRHQSKWILIREPWTNPHFLKFHLPSRCISDSPWWWASSPVLLFYWKHPFSHWWSLLLSSFLLGEGILFYISIHNRAKSRLWLFRKLTMGFKKFKIESNVKLEIVTLKFHRSKHEVEIVKILGEDELWGLKWTP